MYDDYEVSYQVTNSWGDTEVVSVTLSNTGDNTIEDWMLYFDPNGEVQYTIDCQQLTTSDGISYFKNSGYNADVAPDSSVTFGYAVNDCEAVPESFTLCQKRETKTDGYTVSLNVNQSWGDSFSGEIVIQNNTDTAIEAWELTIDTNFTITKITNSWAASVTELEPYSYLLKGTYTGTVAANSSVSLGFIGVKDGEPEISSYSLTEVQVDADYVTLLHCYEDWENLPDTDGDGLPDLYEQLIGTDAAVADTDQDQLPDGYEVKTLNSDPTNANSLDVTQNDGAYDSDKDGLSNYEEYTLGTDPLTADSDHDGLSDGDEVNTYGTDPLKSDTDGDDLSDGDEIALGLNPLVVDTDGDGIPDNEEKIEQSLSYTEEDTTTPIREVTLSFCGTGNISSTTEITPVDDNVFVSNVAGIIGKPFQFTSSSVFETAEVSFYVDTNCLDEVTFDNLGVLWYNEAYQRFELLSCNYDDETSTNSDNWLNVGGSQEGWQNKFISFLEERKEYASLVDYFNTTESIYANADGELVDLHHLAATMTAQIFRGFYNTKRTRTLAGWAGDIRQLMNSAYNLTYLTHDFSDIFDAFYSRMGNNADYFGTEDFYGDVDAVNLFTIFDAAYPEEYADGVSIESLMNDYYGFGLNHRVDMFCVSDSISYDTVCDYTFVNGIDGIFKKEYNFSDLDRKKCANAFIRYLNTNYHQSIEEGSLD